MSAAVLLGIAPRSGMPADLVPASLRITAPSADGATVAGIYSFAVDSSSFPNIATVEFDIASLRLGVVQSAPYEVSWNTGYGKDGNYSLQAIARDATGRIIATGERVFNIANNGLTMSVVSPDPAQEMSGIVKLQVAAYDPVNYPVIFNTFIDGELNGYWDIGSATPTHSVTAVFNIDTRLFANGKHELVIDVNGWKEPASTHIYTNYSSMLDRVITINNGHALMDVAASYQHVYLQPGQTLALSCRDLFTDSASAPCSAPAFRSDNPAVASVSGAGLIQANGTGFTTIAVSDAGKTSKVYLWVKANVNVPHFSGNGKILNSYQPGDSLFPVAPFVLDPTYMSADIVLESKRAAFNTVSFGFYLNTRNTGLSYADWKAKQDGLIGSRTLWARSNGFHILATGDDGFRRPGDDAWWTLNWPYGRQATQYAMQTIADSGVAIAVDVVDEAAMFWGWYPQNPSRVGQQGLPGQPSSFQSVACNAGACTVNWPKHGYPAGRWIGFQGSIHPELNSEPGQPFIIQRTTQDTFDFVASASITATLTIDNDPNLEFMLFAGWPCNAAANDGANHPCAPFTANDAIKTYSKWLRGAASRVPFSWPALGILPAVAHANWVGQSAVDQGVSDYASHYWDVFSGSRTYSWSDGVQQRTFWMKDAFYARQPYMAQDRPQLMLVCGSSFAYIKQTPGAFYNPLGDALQQPGCDGPVATAEIMTAAALGNAGVRQYQFDKNSPADRAAYPAGSFLETGMRPDAVERTSREIWQAAGYASNLITKVLQPYILGLAVSSPGFQRGMTTAVRRGADATMLMVVNGNDGDRSVNVDLTPYRTGAPVARYRVSYSSLQTDLLSDTSADSITLPKGGSVVYLVPASGNRSSLKSAFLQPELPAGTAQASLSYNYIYGEHLSQITTGIECTRGCALQLDSRLSDVYYQFTYTDTNGKVVSRSDVLRADAAALVSMQMPTMVSIKAPGVTYNADGMVTVSVTSPAGTPAGTISLKIDQALMSTTLSKGSAVFAVNGLATGDHVLNASYTSQGGFASGTTTETLHVSARPITVAANPGSKGYGAVDPPLSYRITNGSLVNGDMLSGSAKRAGGEAVGTYTIQQGALSAGANYNLTFNASTFSITPAALTITANNAVKMLGAPNPPFAATYSGFVFGEQPQVLSGTLNFSTATDSTPAGTYPITPGGVTSPNYAITLVNGTLVVTYNVCLLHDPANHVKSGSTIEIKLQLCSASGANESSPSIVLTAESVINLSTNATTLPESPGKSNPDQTFRFDASLGGYLYGLRTSSLSAGTYNLEIAVSGDPQTHAIQFQVD